MINQKLYHEQVRIFKPAIILRTLSLIVSFVSETFFAMRLGDMTSLILEGYKFTNLDFIKFGILFIIVIFVNPYLIYQSNKMIFKNSIKGDLNIFEKLLKNDPEETNKIDAGELSTKVVDTAIEYRWAIIDIFSYSIELVVLAFVLGYFVFKYSWYYVGLLILLTAIGVKISDYSSDKEEDAEVRQMDKTEEIDNQVFGFVDNLPVLHIDNLLSLAKNKINNEIADAHQNVFKETIKNLDLATFIIKTYKYIAYLLILGFGVILVKQGILSIGDVVTISLVYPILSTEIDNLHKLLKAKKMLVDMDDELMSFIGNQIDDSEISEFEKIELKDCTYKYDQENVLNYPDIEINQGDKIALIGENGSGKTTLLNILAGNFKPSTGELLIDGKQERTFLKDNSSYVDAEALMFDEKAMDYLNANCLKKMNNEYISKYHLDDKLDNLTSELSGGERKRLDLLRVILEDKEIVFLDEPEVYLDDNHRELFINEIKNSNKTVVMTTHNDDFIKIANKTIKF